MDDITGLRALAIIPVVAYHARVPGFSGGFVGVDVFFVISGFLITGRLLHDIEARGRVHFGEFWAKRLRRLVPASALMILLTIPMALLFLPPFQWAGIGKQAAAALVFVSNIFFANQTTGYFEADLALPDPYLHTWSLSLEEQFYLFWPVLIAVFVWIAMRIRLRPRLALGIVFGLVAVASFAASVLLTPTHSQDAFYLLPTRAWEFALAGLLALVPADAVRSAVARTILVGAGIVGLVAIVVLLPSDVAYPGSAAMLPTLAALAISWLTKTEKSTRQIAVIRDNPRMIENPNNCLDAPGGSSEKCAVSREEGLSEIADLQAIGAKAQLDHGVAPVFTTVDRLCDFTTCQVELDGIPVYRDNNHLSFEYAQTLAPSLAEFLTETIARAKAVPAS